MKIKKTLSWLACSLTALLVAGSGAQTPSLPAVDLSVGPLTITSQAVNVALALSVEHPTAGAAYRAARYDHASEYLGYWDSKACYEYFDANDNSAINGTYFRRTGAVDSNRYCNTAGAGTGYSGNALNYAATSSIDLLRFALTGGNRVLDTTDKTVLGRAFLPSNFNGIRNGTYFPQKEVAAALVGKVTPQFKTPGASTDYNGTVYFNSCDDIIMVGNSSTAGSCGSPGNANIFAPLVPNLSGSFGTQGFVVAPVNTAATTYVLDPLGQKYWGRVEPNVTTTVMPSGTDPAAGTLAPEAVSPTPRNMSVITSTSATPQYAGDTPVSYTYAATTGTTTTPPTVGPVVITGTNWVANGGSVGTKNYEGIAAELNSSNWGPNGASGTPLTSTVKKNVCRSGTGTNVSNVRLRINGVTDACTGGTSNSNIAVQTFRLYTQQTLYRVYSQTPVYNQYLLVPTWYQSAVYTVYEVYTNGTAPARMKAYVQVCDNAEGGTRLGSDGVRFCKRYPNESAASGMYKPVGELQTRAESVRVSAFGYALEDGNGRYGGVLRAPMKFLGAQFRDTNGDLQNNAQAEWSATTGIFTLDPLNAAAGSSAFPAGAPALTTSGVVNYLNKFGSSGTYKSNDPVGELYYEALRYFQGLQPTDAAVSSLAAAAYDKFPIYKTWVDPIQNGCQRRNFILTIGDVNTHNDKMLPGYNTTDGVSSLGSDTARSAVTIPGTPPSANFPGSFNAVDWTKLLTGFETGTALTYKDALGRNQTTAGNPNIVASNTTLNKTGTGSGGSSAHYWAGAAYWANTQPIRYDSVVVGGKTQTLSEIRVKTFTIDVDEGGDGKIDGNSRGIQPRNSSFYLAGKYGWFNDANDDGNPFKTSGGTVNNKEWEDAALPNVPDGYTLASQAQRMIAGIRKFFASASAQSGALSVSSISSQRFTTSSPNGDLYAPRFDSRDWSGSVIKSSLQLNTTTGTVDALANVIWDSGQILTTGSTLSDLAPVADPYLRPSQRKIVTYRRESGGSSPAIEFTPDNLAQLDTVMRTALNTNPASNVADGLGALRISYLRGERSQEGATTNPFRRRNSILGDIINSGPIYKKEADPGVVDDGGYAAFSQSAASRQAMIYVGANDGMLHATRASDGKELFAYIPLAVTRKLNQLTNPAYQHVAFVDGVPSVGEAKIGGNWRTVLTSGMGGGAQGVFALDVTNPTSFEDGSADQSKVLFEFTDQDDPMMGNVLLQPKLVKIKIPPAVAGGTATYKWFVAVGSGYNNYQNDGAGLYNTSGSQALFLLSLDKTPGTAWSEGSNYFKIILPASSTSIANGLANPGLMLGDRGEATAMYAGDLQGNIWKFDFSDGLSTANINDNKIVKATTSVRQPMFTAITAGGVRQPITVSPLVTTAQQRGVMVIFGTGKFMEQSDANSSGTQSLFGVWDGGTNSTADFNLTRSNLQQQTAVEGTSTITISATAFTLGTATGQKRGWYFDLPNIRERIAVEGAQGTSTITFNSTIPSGDCSGDGNGRSYRLNPVTGAAAGDIAIGSSIGLLSRPNYISLELTDEGNYGARRADGTRKYTVRDAVVTTGTKITSAGNVGAQTGAPTSDQIASGRVSWREIRNFKD